MSGRELVTARLRLEPTGRAHAPELWAATEASLAALGPYLPWAIDPSYESTVAFTKACEMQWRGGTNAVFTVVVDDVACGTVGFNRHDETLASAEMGYWIRSDLAGRGYVTEAGSAALEYVFDELGLHRVELHAAPANVASVRVAEKLGFRREGMLRDAARGVRGWHDVYVYGLLSSDERPSHHLWEGYPEGPSDVRRPQ